MKKEDKDKTRIKKEILSHLKKDSKEFRKQLSEDKKLKEKLKKGH